VERLLVVGASTLPSKWTDEKLGTATSNVFHGIDNRGIVTRDITTRPTKKIVLFNRPPATQNRWASP
jgi:hypothetical protein